MSDDAWAWAHDRDETPPAVVDPAHVCAIVVTHQAGDWLARTLVSLARLDPRPGRLVAVDTGSDDDTRDLLVEAQSEGLLDDVIELDADAGFAAAVTAARDLLGEQAPAWMWLLHDDAEPTRGALGALLTVAASEPTPAAVVPALLRPRRRNHPDRINEVGQSISLTGSRLTGSTPGEIDQQQHESREVLGGSTAALLVRTDAFDAAGGLRDEFSHRQGLDLGWRLRDAGGRVVTAPRATVHHRQVGLQGMRDAKRDRRPAVSDRVSGMRLVASRSPRPALAAIGLMLTGVLRSIALLLGRAPGRALDELRATASFSKDHKLVRELAPQKGVDPDAPRLRPRLAGTVRGGVAAMAAGIGSRVVDLRGTDESDTTIDDLTGDDFSGGRDSALVLPPMAAWIALGIVGLVAGVRLVGGGLTSTGLLPAPSLGQLWASWWHPVAGVPGAPAPWLGFAALASTISFGHPTLLAWLLMVLASLVAAVGARRLLVRLGDDRGPFSTGFAALWGLSLAWLGLLQRGEFGTVAVLVTAPWAGSALLAWARGDRRGAAAWRAPAALALVGCLWVSVQPVLWVPVLVAAVSGAWRRRMWLAGTLVAVAPVVFTSAWWPRLVDQPARLLTSADPLAGRLSASGGPLAVLGRVSQVTSLPTFLVLAVGTLVWVLLLVIWLWRAAAVTRADAVVGVVGLICLAAGAWLPRVSLRLDAEPVRASGAAFVAIGLGCLLLVAHRLVCHDDLAPALVNLTGLLLVATTAATAVGWAVTQDHPASRSASVLPSWVSDLQNSSRAGRALLIDLTTQPARWGVADGSHPAWGTGESVGIAGQPTVAQLAGSIAAGRPAADVAQQLSAAGIAAVWVKGDTSALVGVPGLQATPQDASTTVYSVSGLVSRAMVTGADGGVAPIPDAVIAPGTGSRLVIADPHDTRLTATVGGTSITRVAASNDWRQGFALDGHTGALSWSMRPARSAALTEGLVLLVLLVLTLPAASANSTPRLARGDVQGRRA